MDLQQTQTKAISKMKAKYKAMIDKYIGAEPSLKITLFDSDKEVQSKALVVLNWYNQACDSSHAKKWLYEYLKEHDEEQEVLEGYPAIPDSFFHAHQSAGWVARMDLLDTDNLPNCFIKRLSSTIEKIREISRSSVEKQREKIRKLHAAKKSKKNNDDLERECLFEKITDLDGRVDSLVEGNDQSLITLEYFKDNKITRNQTEEIIRKYQKDIDELFSKDEQIKEAYSFLKPKQRNLLVSFLESVVLSAREWLVNKQSDSVSVKEKKFRKPRKRKVKSPEKQVAKLNYKDKAPEFGLTSIHPTKIIGAEQIWVFNTKYRYLGVYNATDISGFTVKGSTIQNFDEKTSIEKKLRKPAEPLKQVLEGGKVSLRRILSDIKTTERKLTGRLNKDVIILRVI